MAFYATCFACGKGMKATRHHVVPQCLNGKDEDGILHLCKKCHALIDTTHPYRLDHIEQIQKLGPKLLLLIVVRLNAHVNVLTKKIRMDEALARSHRNYVVKRMEQQIIKMAQRAATEKDNAKMLDRIKRACKHLQDCKWSLGQQKDKEISIDSIEYITEDDEGDNNG